MDVGNGPGALETSKEGATLMVLLVHEPASPDTLRSAFPRRLRLQSKLRQRST